MAFDFHSEAVRGLAALRDILDRLIGEAQTSQPLPVDVLETADHFILHAALPGMQPEDVVVQAQGNLITIQAELLPVAEDQQWLIRERPSTSYARTIALPAAIAAEDAHARLVDGLLTLHLPKAAPVTTIALATHPHVADFVPAADVIDEADAIITAHQEDYSTTALTEEVIDTAPAEFTPEEPHAEEQPLEEDVAEEASAAPLIDESIALAEEPQAEAEEDPPLVEDSAPNSTEPMAEVAAMSAVSATAEAEAAMRGEADADVGGVVAECGTPAEEVIPLADEAGEEAGSAVPEAQAEVATLPVRADACQPDLLADMLGDDLAEQLADIPLADVLEAGASSTPVSELAGAHEESHS